MTLWPMKTRQGFTRGRDTHNLNVTSIPVDASWKAKEGQSGNEQASEEVRQKSGQEVVMAWAEGGRGDKESEWTRWLGRR